MAFVNYNNKEITVKIVYYGPALSGKTTCLQYVYNSKEYKKKGKLITLDTDGDRTLFFDFLPIEIGKLGDYSIKMQLYTVPGQVAYDTTRKLVLQGSDGVVFVADSQVVMREQNLNSFLNLKENLKANKIPYNETPLIFQFNKRDLKEILPIEVLNRDLNPENKPFFPTVGTSGENILEGLHTIMKMVIIYLKNKLSIFHKDKTVMFSREEATDTLVSQRKPVMTAPPSPEPKRMDFMDRAKADTEKEDLFELSTPMDDASGAPRSKSPQGEPEEDIFNLDDDNILFGESQELEVPDANLSVELDEIKPSARMDPERNFVKKAAPEPQQRPVANEKAPRTGIFSAVSSTGFGNDANTVGGVNSVRAVSAAVSDGGVEIPLTIHIPKDKDEIKINLNLQIIIKRT